MEQQEELFITTTDLNLPDHSNELSKAEDIIEKLKKKIELIIANEEFKSNPQHDNLHTDTYEEIIRVLDYVGRLSMSAFAIEEQLENIYTLQYSKSPELAKKLWLDHYEKIHYPYSILKNRCFRMLDDLDAEYIRIYKCNPPNFKI